MANVKPIVLGSDGRLKVIQAGDQVDPDVLPAGGGGGAVDFTDLGDVPTSYTGHRGEAVRVNGAQTELEFYDPSDPIDPVDFLFPLHLPTGTTTVDITKWPLATISGSPTVVSTGKSILVTNSGPLNGIYVLGSTASPTAVPITRRADWPAGGTMKLGQRIRVRHMIEPAPLALFEIDGSVVNNVDNELTVSVDPLPSEAYTIYCTGIYKNNGNTSIPGLVHNRLYNVGISRSSIAGSVTRINNIYDLAVADSVTLTTASSGTHHFITVGSLVYDPTGVVGEVALQLMADVNDVYSGVYPEYDRSYPLNGNPIGMLTGTIGTTSSYWAPRAYNSAHDFYTDSTTSFGISAPVALGSGVIARNQSVAVGNSTSASETSVAIGSNSHAHAYSVALGSQATASDTDVAIGMAAKARGNYSVAIGPSAQSDVDSSVALGAYAHAMGPSSVAMPKTIAVHDAELVHGVPRNWANAALTHHLHMRTQGAGVAVPENITFNTSGLAASGELYVTGPAVWRITGQVTCTSSAGNYCSWEVAIDAVARNALSMTTGLLELRSTAIKVAHSTVGAGYTLVISADASIDDRDIIRLNGTAVDDGSQYYWTANLTAHEVFANADSNFAAATFPAITGGGGLEEVTPTQGAILMGATSPVPDGGKGTIRYSTLEQAEMMWTGSSWELLSSLPGDAMYHEVAALVFGKGANNATVDTDRSRLGNAVTFYSNAKLTTSNPPPGSTSSMLFNGGTDRVEVAQSSAGVLQPLLGSKQAWALELYARVTGGSYENNVLFSLALNSTTGLEVRYGTDGLFFWSLPSGLASNPGVYFTPGMITDKWIRFTFLIHNGSMTVTAQGDELESYDTSFVTTGEVGSDYLPTAHSQPLVIGGTKHSGGSGFVGQIAGVRITQNVRGPIMIANAFISVEPESFIFKDASFPVDYAAATGRNGELMGTTLMLESANRYPSEPDGRDTQAGSTFVMYEKNGALYAADGYWFNAAQYPQAAERAQVKVKRVTNWLNFPGTSSWEDVTVGTPSAGDVVQTMIGRFGLRGMFGVKSNLQIFGSTTGGLPSYFNRLTGDSSPLGFRSWGNTPTWASSDQAAGVFGAVMFNGSTDIACELRMTQSSALPGIAEIQYSMPAGTVFTNTYCLSTRYESWVGTSTGKVVNILSAVTLDGPTTEPVVAIKWDHRYNHGQGAFYVLWKNGLMRRIRAGAVKFDETYTVSLNAQASIAATDYADLAILHTKSPWNRQAIAITNGGYVVQAYQSTDQVFNMGSWVLGGTLSETGWVKAMAIDRYIGPGPQYDFGQVNYDDQGYGFTVYKFGASPKSFFISNDSPVDDGGGSNLQAFDALEAGAVVNPKAIFPGPGMVVQSEISGRVYGGLGGGAPALIEETLFQNVMDNIWDIQETRHANIDVSQGRGQNQGLIPYRRIN